MCRTWPNCAIIKVLLLLLLQSENFPKNPNTGKWFKSSMIIPITLRCTLTQDLWKKSVTCFVRMLHIFSFTLNAFICTERWQILETTRTELPFSNGRAYSERQWITNRQLQKPFIYILLLNLHVSAKFRHFECCIFW